MSKECRITGKKANNGYNVSHSHVKTKKIQNVNLQNKKVWLNSRQSWVRMKVSTKGLKCLYKFF